MDPRVLATGRVFVACEMGAVTSPKDDEGRFK